MNLVERVLNLCKSIYVNHVIFPKEIAKKRPIYISYRTKCIGLRKGCVVLDTDQIYSGMIQYGHKANALPGGKSMLLFEEGAKLVFQGKADMDQGIHICVFQDAELVIGNNLFVNTNSMIHCHKKIIIGSDNMWGWNTLVKDSDGHPIMNETREIVNWDDEICIGNNVWLGAYAKIVKGASIPDGCVVGMNSVVTKKMNSQNCMIVGCPAMEKKKDIFWDRGEMPKRS